MQSQTLVCNNIVNEQILLISTAKIVTHLLLIRIQARVLICANGRD